MSSADVIIIGGGIAGTSAGAEIAADASVLLLEAEPHLGYHSTGRSAAIFIRNYGNATLRALNALAVPVLENPAGIADETLLSPRGELLLASEAEMGALESYAAGAEGLDRLTAAEAVALVPILREDRITAAIYENDAQGIDVDRMLQGYARLLRSRGGRVVTDAPVTGLTRSGGLWQVTAGSDVHTAPIVINAAGAWAGQMGQLAGAVPITLTPKRRSAALLPAPDGYETERWPLFGSVAETWYAKPDAGRLMVSPADADAVEPHDAWPDDMVLAEGLHRYECAVTVPVTRVERSWAGLRTFAPDATPVVGLDRRAEGFFWLAGQGGYGVQTAPALSQIAAGLLRGEPSVGPDLLRALSPERFEGTVHP
ncbi:NAD(P)/FAD-dependent oxidoreductase [Roseovarius pelagicus]|uniref:FAD-binding oxidoreductase n=1 Tax=Roseovarius pelagicus TaxID=2980108 RepID=A0ABY6DDT0_9RHOB|nr:FAD-binding oxidoreductase [Roseovarius pelagicus]UXX84312.1 FAD-binding oxidoreductase [Roseovarius pelagicus]